jgi:hypothetical protein
MSRVASRFFLGLHHIFYLSASEEPEPALGDG